ncbi:MAG: xanthine dehydrogenase family protein molybdopterin-binding subunit, partial [Sphingomonadales bacterium]
MNQTVAPASVVMDLPRRDALDKLTGRTRYTIDHIGPDMLHAAIIRSEVASARIVRIDTSRALAMKGVRAVVTYQDAPGLHGIGIADHPLFARDVIRFHGEPLAAIAADTLEIARAAAAAVTVEVEPLSALLTMADALAKDAPLIHPDWQSYEVLKEGAPRGGN